jgi:hypothetical protein
VNLLKISHEESIQYAHKQLSLAIGDGLGYGSLKSSTWVGKGYNLLGGPGPS